MTQSDIISLVSQLETKEDLLALLNKLKFEDLGERSFSFNIRQLNYYANPNHTKGRYRSFEVPKKKKGAMRTISAPSNGLKMLLRYVNVILQALYRPGENTMGFVHGRSVRDNASRHNHQNYILNLDLADFFPSISQARVWKRLQCPPYNLPKPIADIIAGLTAVKEVTTDESGNECVRYVLPQGAPTSPVLTNIICERLDRRLQGVGKRFGANYTRYADDITFSSMHNIYQQDGEFMQEVIRIIQDQGFVVNKEKTRLLKKGSRQEVTGVIVGDKVNVGRDYIRSIRSLLHIWEAFGYTAASAKFRQQHLKDKNGYVKGEPAMESVIAGKLQYVRMLKGYDDPVYQRLRQKLDWLLGMSDPEAAILQNPDYKVLETMPLPTFEEKNACQVQFSMSPNGNRYAFYHQRDNRMTVSVSHDITQTVKPFLAISLCQRRDGSRFHLIHKPIPQVPVRQEPAVKEIEIRHWHQPAMVTGFLRRFTEKGALKYTTHLWTPAEDGSYQWQDFETFYQSYRKELYEKKDDQININDLYHYVPTLNALIRNFLIESKSPSLYWSKEYKLAVSYCSPKGFIADWMRQTGKQPFEMPLAELPKEYVPAAPVQGRTLVYFNDVVGIFKNAIEFRDDQFYYAVKGIFKSVYHHVDQQKLSTLRGLSFYTDTFQVKKALRLIASNMESRTEYPEVEISAQYTDGDDNSPRRLRVTILQRDSFSDKSIYDDKLLLRHGSGQMGSIKSLLRSLCDFSVESRFRAHDDFLHYRIDYLYTTDADAPPCLVQLDKPTEGFKYILTFAL